MKEFTIRDRCLEDGVRFRLILRISRSSVLTFSCSEVKFICEKAEAAALFSRKNSSHPHKSYIDFSVSFRNRIRF